MKKHGPPPCGMNNVGSRLMVFTGSFPADLERSRAPCERQSRLLGVESHCFAAAACTFCGALCKYFCSSVFPVAALVDAAAVAVDAAAVMPVAGAAPAVAFAAGAAAAAGKPESIPGRLSVQATATDCRINSARRAPELRRVLAAREIGG